MNKFNKKDYENQNPLKHHLHPLDFCTKKVQKDIKNTLKTSTIGFSPSDKISRASLSNTDEQIVIPFEDCGD